MIDTLLLRPSLHFTTLYSTSLRSTSLRSTSLHSTSLHFTPLHSTSLHFAHNISCSGPIKERQAHCLQIPPRHKPHSTRTSDCHSKYIIQIKICSKQTQCVVCVGCVCVCVCVYVCLCVCVWCVCVCVCLCVCVVCVCMFVCVCVWSVCGVCVYVCVCGYSFKMIYAVKLKGIIFCISDTNKRNIGTHKYNVILLLRFRHNLPTARVCTSVY
jgi:hypothetical protein